MYVLIRLTTGIFAGVISDEPTSNKMRLKRLITVSPRRSSRFLRIVICSSGIVREAPVVPPDESFTVRSYRIFPEKRGMDPWSNFQSTCFGNVPIPEVDQSNLFS